MRPRHARRSLLATASAIVAVLSALAILPAQAQPAQPPTVLPEPAPPRTPSVAFIARAEAPVDALAASSVAGELGGPVLLSGGVELPAEVADVLNRLRPDLVVICGGESALAATIEAQVLALGFRPLRVGGATRIQTAALLAALPLDLGVERPLLTDGQVDGDAALNGTLTTRALTADAAVVGELDADEVQAGGATVDGPFRVNGSATLAGGVPTLDVAGRLTAGSARVRALEATTGSFSDAVTAPSIDAEAASATSLTVRGSATVAGGLRVGDLATDSAALVENLNADQLDGLSGAQLVTTDGSRVQRLHARLAAQPPAIPVTNRDTALVVLALDVPDECGAGRTLSTYRAEASVLWANVSQENRLVSQALLLDQAGRTEPGPTTRGDAVDGAYLPAFLSNASGRSEHTRVTVPSQEVLADLRPGAHEVRLVGRVDSLPPGATDLNSVRDAELYLERLGYRCL